MNIIPSYICKCKTNIPDHVEPLDIKTHVIFYRGENRKVIDFLATRTSINSMRQARSMGYKVSEEVAFMVEETRKPRVVENEDDGLYFLQKKGQFSVVEDVKSTENCGRFKVFYMSKCGDTELLGKFVTVLLATEAMNAWHERMNRKPEPELDDYFDMAEVD